MNSSPMTHGALTDDSLTTPIGKGREGKGREVGSPSIVSTGWAQIAAWMAADAARFGGGW